MDIMANSNITISLYDNKSDVTPKRVDGSWEDFTQLFTSHDVVDQKDGPAWSPALLKPGTTRATQNVQSWSLLTLDFDNKPYAPVQVALKHHGLSAIVHSTYSHSQEQPHFRVIVPLSRPLAPKEMSPAWDRLNVMLGGGADSKTRDAARIYYQPSHPAGADAPFTEVFEGSALAVDKLLSNKGHGQVRGKAHVPGKNKPAQSKFTDSNGRISRRAVAEDVIKQFHGDLWYHHGQFLVYEAGWWQPLDDGAMVKFILDNYDETTADDADAVVKTLRGLCYEKVNDDEPQVLICLSNGTLNPLTGALQPHSRDDRLTYALDFDWNPEADAPIYDRFLHDVWGNCPDFDDRVRSLHEFCGQIFLPNNHYGHFVWLHGQGANGKSCLSGLIEHVVGIGNVSHAALERLSRASTRASISDKLLNVSAEIGAEATLSDGHLKAMVTGDVVDAEPKYKNPYSVRPRVKFLASTNHLPRLRDGSDGFARRAVILDFPRQFAREEQDPHLEDKLKAEAEGVFVKFIDGLQSLVARGYVLPPPSSVLAVEEYRMESDSVRLFLQERMAPDAGRGTPTGDLFAAYKLWAQDGHYNVPNASKFGRSLTNLGFPVTSKSNGKPYRGLRLVDAVVEHDNRPVSLNEQPERPMRKVPLTEEAFG